MKHKIFKYKFVNFFVFLFALFILNSFGFGLFEELSNIQNSHEYFKLMVVCVIFSLNIISIVLLIKRDSKTVKILNLFYCFFLFFLLFGFIRRFLFWKDVIKERDIYLFFITFLVVIFYLFIINMYKYKPIVYENMEEIGQNEN